MKQIKKSYLVFGLISLLIVQTKLYSQVTIGSSETPQKGAILDLKDSGTYVNNATASKGLGLPRVSLPDLNLLKIGDKDYTGQEAEHIGLLVYNVDKDLCAAEYIFEGLYIWDGDKWQSLGSQIGYRAATPSETSSANIWANDVVLHQKKAGVYNEFVSANFGTAGRWMTTNLAAFAYDGVTYTGGDPLAET